MRICPTNLTQVCSKKNCRHNEPEECEVKVKRLKIQGTQYDRRIACINTTPGNGLLQFFFKKNFRGRLDQVKKQPSSAIKKRQLDFLTNILLKHSKIKTRIILKSPDFAPVQGHWGRRQNQDITIQYKKEEIPNSGSLQGLSGNMIMQWARRIHLSGIKKVSITLKTTDFTDPQIMFALSKLRRLRELSIRHSEQVPSWCWIERPTLQFFWPFERPTLDLSYLRFQQCLQLEKFKLECYWNWNRLGRKNCCPHCQEGTLQRIIQGVVKHGKIQRKSKFEFNRLEFADQMALYLNVVRGFEGQSEDFKTDFHIMVMKAPSQFDCPIFQSQKLGSLVEKKSIINSLLREKEIINLIQSKHMDIPFKKYQKQRNQKSIQNMQNYRYLR